MSCVKNWPVMMRFQIVPCSTSSCEAHILHIVIFTLIKIDVRASHHCRLGGHACAVRKKAARGLVAEAICS